nr:Chain A, AA9 [Panus similis]6RS9_A Chain A, AA9 [Panus similis]
RTVFSSLTVNGVDLGQGVAVRVPSSNAPVTDIESDDIICNTGFIQPVSKTVAAVPAGGTVIAHFHHTSAGYVGPDPSDPLDPTNKGPVLAYLAKVPDATQSDVTGLKWFKIWQDGYTPATRQWGSDKLFINGGNATFTIPSCLQAGQYLLRVESISLLNAEQYPGAQFFLSCGQINITGGNKVQPVGVDFPGAYTSTDPGIVTDIYEVGTYTPPGPAVFSC